MTDRRICKAKIFLIWLFTEHVWWFLFYKIVRLRVSVVVPSDVFGLKAHLRLRLRETSEKREIVKSM